MAVTGFSHYNLRAPRALLDQIRDFYCEVVGLQPGPRPPFRSFGYWLYAGEYAVLHLSEAGPGEVRATQVDTTFDHAAFNCTDLSATESHLTRYGIEYRLSVVPQTGIQQIFFKDPAGNGVELSFAGNL